MGLGCGDPGQATKYRQAINGIFNSYECKNSIKFMSHCLHGSNIVGGHLGAKQLDRACHTGMWPTCNQDTHRLYHPSRDFHNGK